IQALREKQAEDVESLTEQIETPEGQRQEVAASISHLKQTADAHSIDRLTAAIARSDNQRAQWEERQKIIEKLQQDGDGKTVEELEAECEGLAIDEVAAREESLQAKLKDLRKQLGEAGDVRSQARQAYQAIGGDDAAAQAGAAREEALTEMGEVAERYVRVKTSAILLRWAIDRYRREKQAPLLKRAGQLFQVMTAGSFTSLRVDFDDQDNAHLTGVRPDESVVPVSGMSTGTADQLYLALRVASIEDYLERAQALPFVADDLFINFRSKSGRPSTWISTQPIWPSGVTAERPGLNSRGCRSTRHPLARASRACWPYKRGADFRNVWSVMAAVPAAASVRHR